MAIMRSRGLGHGRPLDRDRRKTREVLDDVLSSSPNTATEVDLPTETASRGRLASPSLVRSGMLIRPGQVARRDVPTTVVDELVMAGSRRRRRRGRSGR